MVDQDVEAARSLLPSFIADRLRHVLARRRMTQRDLALAAGIPQATVATYLAGRTAMPVTALFAISRATGVDPGWLLFGEEHRLSVPALLTAVVKTAARTKAFDLSSPEAELALGQAMIAVAEQYGPALNWLWTAGKADDELNFVFKAGLNT